MEKIHVTAKEAKEKNMPGCNQLDWNTFIYSGNPVHHATWLYREALTIFNDCATIKLKSELKKEREGLQEHRLYIESRSKKGLDTTRVRKPDMTYIKKFINQRHLENFKICAGFEVTLKAILLEKGFVVHEISKEAPYNHLHRLQSKKPVAIADLLEISEAMFDGSRPYLPGLLKKSIGMERLICRESYIEIYDIPKYAVDVIRECRNIRNMIHYPGEPFETPARKKLKVTFDDFLIDFIERNLLGRANKLLHSCGSGNRCLKLGVDPWSG